MTTVPPSGVCSHGQPGWCYDDATPEQRAHVEFLHRHAFDYASAGGTIRTDDAEAYACWYVQRYWDDEGGGVAHSTGMEWWRAEAA